MPNEDLVLSEPEAERLLDDLCVKLGFCLPPADRLRLVQHAPADVHAFTDAVLRAEGLDPERPDSRQLHRDVRDVVAAAFGRRTHRVVRLNWLSCLYEFASPAMQAMWLGGGPAGVNVSFSECMCGYFDELALQHGLEAAVRDGWLRPAEATATANFHREADAYEEPRGGHEAVLADPAWARVVAAAQHAWCELCVLITDQEELAAMRELEAKWGSIRRPTVS